MDCRRVVVVGYHAAELLDIACVTTPLVMANAWGARPPYQPCLATPGGRPVTCGSGLTVQAQETLERLTGPLDTLLVSGGIGHEEAAADPGLVAHVRRLARVSRRVASVCTGAGVLAAAGLLDGRQATTHWQWADAFAALHPEVSVDPKPIFVRDGQVATAVGVTSALDLTLAFIEEDNGPEVAREVARNLVTYLQRPGNQAQMSMFTAAPPPGDGLVRRVVDHITRDLADDLSAATLAGRAGVSERHLSRLFVRHLGMTPGRYVRRARTEAAAQLLVTTGLPTAAIAARCGFGNAETLRQAFTEIYGVSPSHYRATQSAATRPAPADPASP
ncbi:GlxA family transcriptional regulator [Streptosporangium sp. NPDC000396]|uniref:GlxA family transcriptional regulator n=1 Tax=Streptosporangium sp. NPDC000396 TaxID=3366185 RepID=UPI0036B21A82